MGETNYAASTHKDLLDWVSELYGKTLDNVVAIIGDNAEVNKALANLCGKPLIGCASHRFNLAIKVILKEQEHLIGRIQDINVKLKSLKLRGNLRSHTELEPKLRNDTRWSSTYQMLERYIKLHPIISDKDFTRDKSFKSFAQTWKIMLKK